MKYKGRVLEVTFWDHVMNAHEPMLIKAYGLCLSVSRRKLVLSHWVPVNEDVEIVKHNQEVATLLRSTIEIIRVLK